jgi:hypothetical protein
LESIVTGPNDEWPIHPDNEWPVRPDPDDEPGESKEHRKKRDTAKPRRALISDDMQSVIIDLSNHKDSQVPDGEWPVLQRNERKPTFEPYEPDKSEEPYWPHLPLPEEPTYFQRVRRITWITGCFMLIATVFTTIITFIYPDEAGYPDVAIFFAVVSGICFVIAYSEQLFLGGDDLGRGG